MKIEEYATMLSKQDLQSLNGILTTIDVEKYPEKYALVQDEVKKRISKGETYSIGVSEKIPTWKIQKNWYRINAIIVGISSALSFFGFLTVTEAGYHLDFNALTMGVWGVIGVSLYFWKFKIGHRALLLWWLVQLISIETTSHRYSVVSGLNINLELQLGPVEIAVNMLAAISIVWSVWFYRYYESKVKADSEAEGTRSTELEPR